MIVKMYINYVNTVYNKVLYRTFATKVWVLDINQKKKKLVKIFDYGAKRNSKVL